MDVTSGQRAEEGRVEKRFCPAAPLVPLWIVTE